MRTSRRYLLLAALVGAVALWTPAGALGAGATYDVIQCHALSHVSADAQLHEPRPYAVTRACADADIRSLRIQNVLGAKRDRRGAIFWQAPEKTALVGVRAVAKLRRARGHRPQLYVTGGNSAKQFATVSSSPSPFRVQRWSGPPRTRFVAALRCIRDAGCPQSDAAKTWLRDVKLTLVDRADPEVTVDGSLLSGGWKREEHVLSFKADDQGSGLTWLFVRNNGVDLHGVDGTCLGRIAGLEIASRLRPCETNLPAEGLGIQTELAPFHDGQNAISICATDFAGNRTCENRQVKVDNTAPTLAFRNAQDPEDPELVQAPATDAHSGVAEGQIYYRAEGEALWQPLETVVAEDGLRARVDSTAVPAGPYEFRAVATDVAGNTAETTVRENGFGMRLEFPLKSGVTLDAHLTPGGSKRMTIPYGKRSSVRGLLRSASGDPMPGQEVVVQEYFGAGALIRERITRLRTDANGRWQELLPAGPSRRVTAHYAGDQRYLPTSALGGRLAVRTKASLRTSRRRVPEGKRVVFRGRLGRRGARIPAGGKLLELQVKEDTKTFQTVGESFRSRPNGRFRIGYRFGRFYAYDVRFKFRVKVAREADWPYKAPARSNARTVTVLDR